METSGFGPGTTFCQEYGVPPFWVVFTFLLILSVSQSHAMGTKPKAPPEAGRILVRFHDGVTAERVRQIVIEEGCREVQHLETLDIYIVEVPAAVGVEGAIKAFLARTEVRSAERDAKAKPQERQ